MLLASFDLLGFGFSMIGFPIWRLMLCFHCQQPAYCKIAYCSCAMIQHKYNNIINTRKCLTHRYESYVELSSNSWQESEYLTSIP